MSDGVSVGNDQTGSDSIDAANDAASSAFNDSSIEHSDARPAPDDPLDGMRSVADQLRGQIHSNNKARGLPDETNPQTASSSALSKGVADHAKTLDDGELASAIKSREAQLKERKEQLQLAEQTEDYAGAISNTAGLAAGIAGLGDSIGRGVMSVAAGFGVSVAGKGIVEGVAGNSADVAFNETTRLEVEVRTLKAEQQQRADQPVSYSGPEISAEIPARPGTNEALDPTGPAGDEEIPARPVANEATPERQPTADESTAPETTASLISEGFAERAMTLDDIELESQIRSNKAQLKERKEQLHLAEQTEDNAGAIANGAGLVAGIAGLGGSLARGIASVAASFGISVGGKQVIETVVGNSADVAFNEINRLEARVRTLEAEQQRRIDEPPTGGREVSGEIPERPDVTESLPEQIEAERTKAKVERDKQRQFENIAESDPAFRDQALQEAADSADKAAAAEQRAEELQQQQDQKVNELAAAEEQRAAREIREQQRQERDDRSEPNGGQVGGADPGVGRNDVPDSF